MGLLQYMETDEFEQVIYCLDKPSGLRAIIAIHDTTLGPAIGGVRMREYATEEEALQDVLRLAKGMTYKNAATGLNLGGGKAVIIGDPEKDKSEALLRAFGRYVQSLNGRYITAEDVGTTVEDMDVIYEETDYVTGVSQAFGSSGNPAPVTAYGVYNGMKAAAKHAFGTDSLTGKTIAIQGAGHVAYSLCELLVKEKAEVIITDIRQEAVEKVVHDFQVSDVEPEDIYTVPCDIFSPCALGGIINDETIPQLKAKVIAGSANNQLAEPRHGDLVHERGIIYAPDYVLNAGGVINVADELQGYNRERALKKVESIYDNIDKVITIAQNEQIPTYKAADRLAEKRIQLIRNSRNQFLLSNKHILSKRLSQG